MLLLDKPVSRARHIEQDTSAGVDKPSFLYQLTIRAGVMNQNIIFVFSFNILLLSHVALSEDIQDIQDLLLCLFFLAS